jgi:hypothetical protein
MKREVKAHLHIHARDRVILQVLIVIFKIHKILIEWNPSWSNEIREELKFFLFRDVLLVGPIVVVLHTLKVRPELEREEKEDIHHPLGHFHLA